MVQTEHLRFPPCLVTVDSIDRIAGGPGEVDGDALSTKTPRASDAVDVEPQREHKKVRGKWKEKLLVPSSSQELLVASLVLVGKWQRRMENNLEVSL